MKSCSAALKALKRARAKFATTAADSHGMVDLKAHDFDALLVAVDRVLKESRP